METGTKCLHWPREPVIIKLEVLSPQRIEAQKGGKKKKKINTKAEKKTEITNHYCETEGGWERS